MLVLFPGFQLFKGGRQEGPPIPFGSGTAWEPKTDVRAAVGLTARRVRPPPPVSPQVISIWEGAQALCHSPFAARSWRFSIEQPSSSGGRVKHPPST